LIKYTKRFYSLAAGFFLSLAVSLFSWAESSDAVVKTNAFDLNASVVLPLVIRGIPSVGERPSVALNGEYFFSRSFYVGSSAVFPLDNTFFEPALDGYFGYLYHLLGLSAESGFIRYDMMGNIRFPAEQEFYTFFHWPRSSLRFFIQTQETPRYYLQYLVERSFNKEYSLRFGAGYWFKESESNASDFYFKLVKSLSRHRHLHIAFHNQHEGDEALHYWALGVDFSLYASSRSSFGRQTEK
jgi:hypothetical protein